MSRPHIPSRGEFNRQDEWLRKYKSFPRTFTHSQRVALLRRKSRGSRREWASPDRDSDTQE